MLHLIALRLGQSCALHATLFVWGKLIIERNGCHSYSILQLHFVPEQVTLQHVVFAIQSSAFDSLIFFLNTVKTRCKIAFSAYWVLCMCKFV